jgi:hypothetical protein
MVNPLAELFLGTPKAKTAFFPANIGYFQIIILQKLFNQTFYCASLFWG